MNDTFPSILDAPNPPEPAAPSGSPADRGLRSSQGIRWLLLAGALVCGVSVYRLVQGQWSFLPPPLQFLILVLGALAIYGLGSLTRRRLHLPYAGSALLSLFAGLVPVLSWGAAYLDLLQTPSGWLVFGAGLAVLLGASRRVLIAELGYRGHLYPAILGVLLAAQAVLPWLADRFPVVAQGIYLAAALLLGGLLHLGSLHINRFFFHRDRQDGIERPVRFVPFLILGLLYVGAMTLLDMNSTFMALPLAVLGLVLAATGEEYYRALTEAGVSEGAAPARWPGRSVALIAVGLCLLAGAVPLAQLDRTGLCLALVTLGSALFLLRWGVRYRTATLYAAGLAAALAAYISSPALFRPLAELIFRGVTNATGLSSGLALFALSQLGFFALLAAGAAWLRRVDAPERLRQVHAVAAGLHLIAITCFALVDPEGFLVLPWILALGLLGAVLGRRGELAIACVAPSLALVVALQRLGAPGFQVALLTQAFFVLSWLSGRRESFFARGGRIAAVCHAFLGLIWLGLAILGPGAGAEALILLLVGAALLDEGVRDRRRDLTLPGLGLIAAFPLVQIGAGAGFVAAGPWLLGHIATAVVLAGMILVARRGARIARTLALDDDAWRDLILLPLAGLVDLWGAAAVVLCLIFAGPEALALAVTLAALVFLARIELAGRAPRAALPLRPSLLLILQAVALAGSTGEWFLPLALLSQGFELLPLLAVLVLAWRLLGEVLGRRWALEPWGTLAEGLVAVGYLAGLFFSVERGLAHVLQLRPDLSPFQHLTLMGAAALWAGLSFASGRRSRRESDAWAMQVWAGLVLVQAFVAGWLVLGSGVTPYVLLGASIGLYAMAQLLARTDLRAAFTGPCRTTGLLLPLAAGVLALDRAWGASAVSVWFPVLAAFLVSLFYLIVASREERRIFPSLASAGLLGMALLAVIARAQLGLGLELYFLAPGLALLTLAWLLRTELGERWSRHVVAAGASCLYATPIVALSGQISWGWLAALLVLAVAFGAASFGLRSRSLLTVSTAALLTDLGFFVFHIGSTAPTALWGLGALFGLSVMGAAAWLEYQREGVLQQIRVFGRELRAWS